MGWSACLLLILIPAWLLSSTSASANNPLQDENARPGTVAWELNHPATDHEIEGYASLTSINRGDTIRLFVRTPDPFYTIDIYRMGWYGGSGARLMLGDIVRQAVPQPPPFRDPTTGLVECDWTDPYVLTTASQRADEWRSGVYLAKLTAGVTGAQSYIIFVVREDDRPSDYLFQSSVTTYQAYNNWGGKSLYDFNSSDGRRASHVSFNRPYAPSSNPLASYGVGAGEFLTNLSVPPHDPSAPAGWEYNLVRWLEREGYDVTYSTSLDTHSSERRLVSHKAWLSVGHDEYWTWDMRIHVERALDAGVNLAFFSANICYWQIRLVHSPFTHDAYRIMVSYKDEATTADPYALDGDPANDHLITTRWREAPVNRPEDALVGVMYESNPTDGDVFITNPTHWIMSDTGVGPSVRLPRLLGYEADRVFSPLREGLEILAHSPYQVGLENHVADMTLVTRPSGAMVFSTGTIQWSWALDDFNAPRVRRSVQNVVAEQITRNVLARFAGPRNSNDAQPPASFFEAESDMR